MAKDTGLTLVELLVVLIITALAVGMALPSLAGLVSDARLTSTTNQFITTLHYARSEAIKRGGTVTLCKSSDSGMCRLDDGWEQGWIVFADTNGNGLRDLDEDLLTTTTGHDGELSIIGNHHVQNYIAYRATGAAITATGALQIGTVTVCLRGQARRIILNRAGRPRTERGSC